MQITLEQLVFTVQPGTISRVIVSWSLQDRIADGNALKVPIGRSQGQEHASIQRPVIFGQYTNRGQLTTCPIYQRLPTAVRM